MGIRIIEDNEFFTIGIRKEADSYIAFFQRNEAGEDFSDDYIECDSVASKSAAFAKLWYILSQLPKIPDPVHHKRLLYIIKEIEKLF